MGLKIGLAAALSGGSGAARAQASANRWRMPAEEEPHARTFMQWPVSRAVYDDRRFLRAVQKTIADIANTISQFEPLTMLAAAEHHADLRRQLAGDIELWDIPTEDLWCRGSGPIFVVDDAGGIAAADIRFNGWGDKQVHRHDGQVARRVAERLGIEMLPTGLVGEAGGVEQDGHGLLMAHESSWVNDNRNPGMDRDEIGRRLLAAYGADGVIWSPGVWDEDITDYHIDSLARFTGRNDEGVSRVLLNLPDEPDPRDPFHQAALETHDILAAYDLDLEVIPEPSRRRVRSADFVASYVNYYVCNGGVVAAQFGDDEADDIALDALQRHYPGREVVMLNADALGEIGGGIHCATKEMPG